MKKILFILSLFCLISCDNQVINDNQSNNKQPQTTVIKSDNIQYDIKWGNNNVDVRIITLSKDGETHDYVITSLIVYKGGGISTDHWAGCKCMKDSIK